MKETILTILFVIFMLLVVSIRAIESMIKNRLKKIYPDKWESFVYWFFIWRLRPFYFARQIRENKMNDKKLISYFKKMKILIVGMILVWIGALLYILK